MMRLVACSLCLFLATVTLAEDELPKDPETSFDVEPPLANRGTTEPARASSRIRVRAGTGIGPERIGAALEKAKRRTAAGERLFRSGVNAKVEVENRALAVVPLQADLASAQFMLVT